jgi:hypothetical protein
MRVPNGPGMPSCGDHPYLESRPGFSGSSQPFIEVSGVHAPRGHEVLDKCHHGGEDIVRVPGKGGSAGCLGEGGSAAGTHSVLKWAT